MVTLHEIDVINSRTQVRLQCQSMFIVMHCLQLTAAK